MRKVQTRQTKSGTTYFVRFRHGASPTDPTKPLETSEAFDTYEEAEEFAKRLDIGVEDALEWLRRDEEKVPVPSLNAVAADHIRLLEGVSPGYRAKQAKNWERYWSGRVGKFPADAINRDHLREAMQDLADNGIAPGKGYAVKSLKNARGLMHGVLERCVEQKYLDANPGKRMRLPGGRFTEIENIEAHDDEDDEKVFLSLEEFAILLAATHDQAKPLVHFLVHTGLRWGEATALQVRDINFDGIASVRVRRAWKESGVGGRLVLGPPKTKTSRRTVTINADVVANLRALCEGRKPNDWVFTAPRGGLVRHRTFWDQRWHPAIFKAQHCEKHIPKDCKCGTTSPRRCTLHYGKTPLAPCGCPGTLQQKPRIHDLRHTQASWLIAAGFPLAVVRDRLGHESIQTTVNIYGHLDQALRAAAAEAGNFAAIEAGSTKDAGDLLTEVMRVLASFEVDPVLRVEIAQMLTQRADVVDAEVVELAALPQ